MNELFEITTIAARDSFIVLLNNADDEPLKNNAGDRLSVSVYGPGSKPYAKATATRTQRMLDRMAKKGRVKLNAEEQVVEAAEFLAAVTISFNDWAYKGGFDATAILSAYKDPTIGFIADQVQKAVGDWANFSTSGIPS
jgi:hypothetical protein